MEFTFYSICSVGRRKMCVVLEIQTHFCLLYKYTRTHIMDAGYVFVISIFIFIICREKKSIECVFPGHEICVRAIHVIVHKMNMVCD